MDLALLPLLRCPVGGGPLELRVIAPSGEGVETGVLYSRRTRHWYPIINHVPVMLTFRTALVEAFARDHAGVLAEIGDCRAPDQSPMPGERSVQATFTEEWSALGDDDHTFVYTDDQLETLHRDVWLRMTDDERAAVTSVLNVGIGFGKETRVLADLFANAMTVGVDLNLALVSAGKLLAGIPRTHAVVASLFRLPFEASAFDHVHSQGVIHHTYSTKAAFDAIAPLVKPRGSLFIWVYGAEDAHVVPGLRGWMVWLYWVITHRIFRPVLSRSPAAVRRVAMYAIAGVLHPFLKLRNPRGKDWRFVNTLHGLYDSMTPRYAHQHGFNEVVEWFEDAGFEPRLQSPATYRKLMGSRLLGVGVNGRRKA
ncbi:MAG: methyltransferase domain-containing protein [Hyphomicrobiaceae bacterium]